MSTRHILIIGGGASGLILAAHLLRAPGTAIRVTLVESRDRLGQGLAYDTPHAAHLLNTRVGAMSAFSDAPDHFRRWLAARNLPADPQSFVPRHLFADYLAGLVAGDGRLRWEHQECVDLQAGRDGATARLADGRVVIAGAAVLATGHMLRLAAAAGPGEAGPFAPSDPWHAPPPEDPQARVLILGSGLTMVDRAMRLLEAGHRGEIVVVSRNGLLPQVNAPSRPVAFDRADLPLGVGAGYALGWLRGQIRWHEARGGDWRDVVDGARDHLALWWQSVPMDVRARFLRHARRFWEVHRHRIPRPVAARLGAARREGRIRFIAGRLVRQEPIPGGFRAVIRHRGGTREEVLDVAQISDGRGLLRDPADHASRLVEALVASGLARIDPLRIGLDVTPEGRVVARDGAAAETLFAIGPAARSASWESLAIVDIRAAAQRLAPVLARVPETAADSA